MPEHLYLYFLTFKLVRANGVLRIRRDVDRPSCRSSVSSSLRVREGGRGILRFNKLSQMNSDLKLKNSFCPTFFIIFRFFESFVQG